jgi:hypothetical protein
MLKRAVVVVMIMVFTAASAGTEEPVAPIILQSVIAKPGNFQIPERFLLGTRMTAEMWRYLRAGLNYVESSGREYPTDFVHPGGVAYGPLAMTRIATKDVLLHHKELSRYTINDVLSNKALYERFSLLYADMLLGHYFKLEYWKMPKEEVFDILQRAWFLGPGLYKKGCDIIASRKAHAREYIASAR